MVFPSFQIVTIKVVARQIKTSKSLPTAAYYSQYNPSGPKGLKPGFKTSLNFMYLVPFHFVDL